MLKFTKYGKKTSGSFTPIGSTEEMPEAKVQNVVLSAFSRSRDDLHESNDDELDSRHFLPLGESQSMKRAGGDQRNTSLHENGDSSNGDKITSQKQKERRATLPGNHLSFSKIPREELVRLDSEMFANHEGAIKRVRFSDSQAEMIPRQRTSTKCSRTTLVSLKSTMGTVKVKVPVYNDGFFPRIQPLSKIFAMKRSKVD